ncbi:MAG: amino acid adenylation domain-containing protein, partial [Planctomycetota bacterium]
FEYVLRDADVTHVLATQETATRIPEGDFRISFFEDVAATVASVDLPEPALEDAAYLIYTSGSTGRPKGVVITHANLAASNAARFAYYSRSPGRYLLLSSFAFDSSVAGIFWTLTAGGGLVLPEPGQEQDVDALAGLIAQYNVTHLLCLPTLYRLLLEAAPSTDMFASLTTSIVAGEALSSDVVKSHFQLAGNAQLHNEYGPTEGTVWATAYHVQADDIGSSIPIGRSIPGAEVYLLDGEQRPVTVRSTGEIYVCGPGVAAGYLNQEAVTADKFVDVSDLHGQTVRMYRTGDLAYYRDDGEIVFAGRVDSQVKIRGYRIELDEIESRLRMLENVDDAVVIARSFTEQAPPKILAYVVCDDRNESAIKAGLASDLADFMLPERIIFVDEFPRLSNGKVDRKALPLPESAGTTDAYVAPRNEAEKKLAAIWSATIGVDKVGIHDNFFALGGDSIISIRVISRARREGFKLMPKMIADHPTVAQLATIASGIESDSRKVVDSTSPFPLSPIQKWFFEQEMPAPHHWNMSMMFQLPAEYDLTIAQSAIAKVVSAHPMLHATFAQDTEGTWTQKTGTPAEVLIETRNVAGLSNDEVQAICLEAQGSLDLSVGPLFKLLKLESDDSHDHLLFVVHHLVIDAVSWSILIDEINHGYNLLSSGKDFSPEHASGSFAAFVAALIASVDDRNSERPYWESIGSKSNRLPFDADSNLPVTSGSVESLTREVHGEVTTALRGAANVALNTSTNDLLVAAVALAVSAQNGIACVTLDLESHGRESVEGLDVTGTVGWFTSVYPVELNVRSDELRNSIQSVKETLRSVPDNGAGFGVLRYLNDASGFERSGRDEPRVLFNFLGVRSAYSEDVLLTPADGASATSRHRESTGGHPIEINATIEGDRLIMEWLWCSHLFNKETVEHLADQCNAWLERIVEELDDSRAGYTPSDFPEAELSQAELDDLLDDLD